MTGAHTIRYDWQFNVSLFCVTSFRTKKEEFKEERLRNTGVEDSEGLRGGKLLGSGIPVGGQKKHFGTEDSSPADSGTITNANLLQAREIESRGEYLRAIECYLKIRPDSISEESADNNSLTAEMCQHAWLHAANLAVKFLPSDSSAKVAELVASRLVTIGVSVFFLHCFIPFQPMHDFPVTHITRHIGRLVDEIKI